MKLKLLTGFTLITFCASAQLSEQYLELKTFAGKQASLQTDSSEFLFPFSNKTIHYLYPLYKAFQKEKQLLASQDKAFFYGQLTQAVSFAGDYLSTLQVDKLSRDSLSEATDKTAAAHHAELAKTIQYTDAKQYILRKADSSRVIMINEAHNKPLHRVFTASLLEGLYQRGFRYLAMETFNNYKYASLDRLNIYTGHFTCEPIGGELVRRALEIGFKLVAYEDTLSQQHSPNQREYAQAANLYAVLKKDGTAKILVHAGYGHVAEAATHEYIPMAAYFSVISGIDPFTIDQTNMTEGGTTAYEADLYNSWLKLRPTTTPVIPLKSDTAFDPFSLYQYDVHVIHPPTKYLNGRPTWMSMNGWKKETAVTPAYQSLFMVQAYYANEYSEKGIGLIVPADQTYITASNGYYYLYLHKGKYKLVYRDKLYAVLGTRDITVD